MKHFIEYIGQFSKTPLSETEYGLLMRAFMPKKLRKKQYFLQEGEVSMYFGFVLKGAMRQYYVDEKGIEHIIYLSIENWWVGDRESYVMLTPSIYNIDAWEDTELLIVSRANILDLIEKVPAIAEMIRQLDERNNIAAQKRLTSAISFSAEKRYADFATNHPDLLQRFPQHLIASYLGITKETLSRIRKHAIKQSGLLLIFINVFSL